MTGGGDGGGERAESSVVGGGGASAQPWSRVHDGSYLFEIMRRDELNMRPQAGRIVLARTAGMVEQEMKLRGSTVFMTVEGGRRALPDTVLAVLEEQCSVLRTKVTVEAACPPFHCFVHFDSIEDRHRVVARTPLLRCGVEHVRDGRWCQTSRGTQGKFDYKCVLSIEGLPWMLGSPKLLTLFFQVWTAS